MHAISHGLDKLVAYELHKPYARVPSDDGNGRTNLSLFREKKGLYAIIERGYIVYVSSCYADIYKAVMQRFQQRPRSYANRLKAGTPYEIAVFICPYKIADRLAQTIIAKAKPRDNKPSHQPPDRELYAEFIAALKSQFAGRRCRTVSLFAALM